MSTETIDRLKQISKDLTTNDYLEYLHGLPLKTLIIHRSLYDEVIRARERKEKQE